MAVLNQPFAGDQFAEHDFGIEPPGSMRRPSIAFSNARRIDGSEAAPRAIANTVDAGCWASDTNSCGRGFPICVDTRSAVTPTTV